MLESDSIPLGKKFILAPMGLDPAIRSNIEITQFFLDGRVKHGHEKGDISPRRVDEGVPLAPIESEKLTARLKPPAYFSVSFNSMRRFRRRSASDPPWASG
jgi:hypothetical protein